MWWNSELHTQNRSEITIALFQCEPFPCFLSWDTDVLRPITCLTTCSTCPFHDWRYWRLMFHYLFDLSVKWLEILTFNVSLAVRPVGFMTEDTDISRLTTCSTCPFHDWRYWHFTSHYLLDLSVSWLEILKLHVSLPVGPVGFMTWDTDVLRLTTAVRPVRCQLGGLWKQQ